MSIEWEKDKHGQWTLNFKGEKVHFLTPQQKKDLQSVFKSILNRSKSEN